MEELFKLKEQARLLGIDMCWGKEFVICVVTKHMNAVFYKKELHQISEFLKTFSKPLNSEGEATNVECEKRNIEIKS